MRYYIDTEFDGHNGPLLSLAIINGCHNYGTSLHVHTTERATNPWVIANVEPHMDSHLADFSYTEVHVNGVGEIIREFLACDVDPVIVADSPVDIARFCTALSTSEFGQWTSANWPRMTFEIHNVDCYPTKFSRAVRHNAWWDAMALLIKLDSTWLKVNNWATLL